MPDQAGRLGANGGDQRARAKSRAAASGRSALAEIVESAGATEGQTEKGSRRRRANGKLAEGFPGSFSLSTRRRVGSLRPHQVQAKSQFPPFHARSNGLSSLGGKLGGG